MLKVALDCRQFIVSWRRA